jgi:XTP/dITP diphosphohydrolase
LEVWIATSNKGKLIEYKTLLEKNDIQVHSQSELAVFSPPPETGQTFLDNARIKAKALKSIKKDNWVLGEDSGLEVSGLNNFPGVHSARYAGPKASDAENIAKLMKMMSIRSANQRSARFVCTVVLYDPSGTEHVITAELKGQIAKKVAGQGGFGYDPVFIPEGYDKTLSELGAAVKNKISHRAQVIGQIVKLLRPQ